MNAASLRPPPEATLAFAPPQRRGEASAWPVAMLGLPIENLSLAPAVERIAAMIAAGRAHLVTVTTAARLVRAQAEPMLLRQLAAADLVLYDSCTLKVASWWLGNPLGARVRPVELTRRLAHLAAVHGWRVALLGSSSLEIARTEQWLRRSHPTLTIVGTYAPLCGAPFDGLQATRSIRAARPDLVIAWSDASALDGWLVQHHAALGVPVCLHFPGSATPAPSASIAAISAVVRRWRDRCRNAVSLLPRLWAHRRWLLPIEGRSGGLRVIRADRTWVDILVGENLTRASLNREPPAWRYDVMPSCHCAVDVSRVRHIDATGVAFLMRHRVACQRANRHMILVSPSPALIRALANLRLLDWFEAAVTAEEARQQITAVAGRTSLGILRSLAWCGEIVASNAEDVWQTTSDYVRGFTAAGATLIVVDLARLRFIDEAGASLMVRVKDWARELRTEILFTHPQTAVLKALRSGNLDYLLLEGDQ